MTSALWTGDYGGMARIPPPPEHGSQIAERLRLTRLALGLRPVDIVKRTGIKANTYSQWEKGYRPDLDEALKLCKALGYTLEWIYRGDPTGLPFQITSQLAPEVFAKRA